MNLAILISGSGTNLQAIIDEAEAGRLPGVNLVVVVSNRRNALGLQRAERHGIPTELHLLKPYREAGRSRETYDADLAALLQRYNVDRVVLAGWMHLLSMAFLKHYPNRVINLHPALPGQFPGTHAIERAFDAFQRGEVAHTGVMVHFVPDEGVDVGPTILQEVVPILPGDTLQTLEARVHETEHRLLPEAIRQVLSGETKGAR